MSVHFAELTWPQVAEIQQAQRVPVLLLPLGAIEPHGPHAPLNTDPLISSGMCERAARAIADDPEVHALVLPSIDYGVTRYGAAFAGAVGIAEETLHALVVDVCTSLIGQGFRRVVLVNNHFEPEHVATLRAAAESVEARTGVRPAHLELTRRANAERLTEEFRSGSCHAGRYETSLVLADRPELVDVPRMRAAAANPVDMPVAMAAGRKDFLAMGMDQAYCGAPAEATADEGEATFATLTEMLVDLVREVARR